jgi:hypothetical protein
VPNGLAPRGEGLKTAAKAFNIAQNQERLETRTFGNKNIWKKHVIAAQKHTIPAKRFSS